MNKGLLLLVLWTFRGLTYSVEWDMSRNNFEWAAHVKLVEAIV